MDAVLDSRGDGGAQGQGGGHRASATTGTSVASLEVQINKAFCCVIIVWAGRGLGGNMGGDNRFQQPGLRRYMRKEVNRRNRITAQLNFRPILGDEFVKNIFQRNDVNLCADTVPACESMQSVKRTECVYPNLPLFSMRR